MLSSLVHEEVIRLCTVCIHSMCMHLLFYIYVCTVCNTHCLIIAAGALCIIILYVRYVYIITITVVSRPLNEDSK